MDPVDYEESRAAIRDRFIIIATETRLRRRDANRSSFDLNKLQASGNADERLAAFATEILAVEGHKLTDDYDKTLSPRLKERFDAVSAILDRHVVSGEHGADKRRAVLERAEEYASFSPHYHGFDKTDDNEGVRDDLNELDAHRQLPRYLLDRELGVSLHKYPNLGPNAESPGYTGELKHDFTAQSARELTDALGHLHQTLHDRVRQEDPFFINISTSDAVALQRNRWPIKEETAQLPNMERLGQNIAVQPQERALERIARKQTERAERLQREMSDDSFLRDPSPKPTRSLKRRRDTSDEDGGPGESFSNRQPARRRRLMPRGQVEEARSGPGQIHGDSQQDNPIRRAPDRQARQQAGSELPDAGNNDMRESPAAAIRPDAETTRSPPDQTRIFDEASRALARQNRGR